jgi:type I restriction enzyme S subunit
LFPKDTVLVAMYGATIGACSILPYEASTNQACAAFLPREDVFPEYLYYFLNSKKDQFVKDGVGGAQPNISAGYLKNVNFDFVSLDEQKTIIDILNKVDSLISLRKLQLSKLEELVKSRFIEMFGDPIDNPKGLPVKTLKKLSILITNGNTPKGGSENYVDKGILFLRSQNVWRNRIELDDVAYIDDATHRSLKKSSLKHKDILITKTGRINTENSSLGRAALYLGDDDSANINGHVYLVRLDGSVVPEYVVTILTSEAYRKYIRKVCVGGIDKRQINLDQVEDFPIILPPIDWQQQFATFVERIDKSKATIQKSLEKLETLKKALMQKYFG